MRFRVATLNLDQDHKRWDARRHLIGEEIANLRPDILALNEVSVPLQSARGLWKSAAELTGVHYNLVQQARANSLSKIEGEALLTRFPCSRPGTWTIRPATWWRWWRAFSSTMRLWMCT